MPAPAYQPRMETTSDLLAAPTVAMAVGEFSAAKSVNNTRLSLRGNGMTGGEEGTFTRYLQRAIEAELRTAGLYDGASRTILSGVLLENEVNAMGVDTGTAHLAVKFQVVRQDETVYDRELATDGSWVSHFMGVIAVQSAMQGYVATVQELIGKLFADPEFRAAVSP
jgi:hypothetical protein